MGKTAAVVLVGIALASAPFAKAQSLIERLSVEEARKHVYAATDPQLTGVPLEEDHSLYDPGFINLVAIDTNPDHRPVMATYAVNAWTGDVWNTVGRCRRVSSAKLRNMLKELQSRSAIDLKAFEQFRNKTPRLCDVD